MNLADGTPTTWPDVALIAVVLAFSALTLWIISRWL